MSDEYNKYLQRMYLLARNNLISLTRETESQILKTYKIAGNDLVKKFNRSKEGSATRAYYSSYIRSLNDEILNITKTNGLSSAEIPKNLHILMNQKIFKDAGMDETLISNFNRSYGKIPKNSINKILSGSIYKDDTTLSSRIWGNSLRAGADIQQVIASGLAQKMSASELSKTLQVYVDPSARKTWGNEKIKSVLGDGYAKWNKNLEYNALRLARTTLTHSFQLANIDSCKKNPYIQSIQWHSVLQHGRTCDICRERDGKIFSLDDVPLDHPNGLCYQTAVINMSLNEIADDLKKWLKAS